MFRYFIEHSSQCIFSERLLRLQYQIMKKKVQQKKEIIPVFTPTLFWTHRVYSQQELTQIDTFLTTFDKQLRTILIESTVQANAKLLFDKIGLAIHPSLAIRTKNPENKHLSQEGYGQRFIIFLNHRIDCATIKLISFLLTCVKINSLKFSNNNLSDDELKLLIPLLSKQDNVSTIFFEWNSVISTFYTHLVRPSLVSLILRSSKIGDAALKQVISKILSTADCKLKYLDLYDNNLTAQSVHSLTKLLQENRSIEQLNISKNQISKTESIESLFKGIGNVKLSEEEFTQYKKLQKERDQIVQRNKKRKKNTPEQALPFLLPIQQIQGQWNYMKNSKLKGLNLSWNRIDNVSTQTILKFIERLNSKGDSGFELGLLGNNFNSSNTQILRETPGIKI